LFINIPSFYVGQSLTSNIFYGYPRIIVQLFCKVNQVNQNDAQCSTIGKKVTLMLPHLSSSGESETRSAWLSF